MRRSVLIIVLLGLLAAGCGGSEDSDPAPVTAAALEGSAFTAVEAEGFQLDQEGPLTISFEQGSVSVDAGCNSISGDYEIENDAIRAKLISTLMGCPPPLDEIERRITAMLSGGAGVRLEGDTLILTGDDGVELTLER